MTSGIFVLSGYKTGRISKYYFQSVMAMLKLIKRFFTPFSISGHVYKRNVLAAPAVTGRKTVPDLFRMDLNHLPLHDFTEGKVEVNANGDIIQNYFKKLDYKECGVFDTVHVKLTGSKSVNIIFRCSEPSMVDNDKLRAVIDSICDIYGQDNNGLYGAAPDESQDHKFYVLFGRNWMDYPKYKYPVSVRRYAEDVFISVWGFTHQEVVSGC